LIQTTKDRKNFALEDEEKNALKNFEIRKGKYD